MFIQHKKLRPSYIIKLLLILKNVYDKLSVYLGYVYVMYQV